MKTMVMISSVAVCLLGAAHADASPCSDRFTAVEAKVKEQAAAAISASGGGEGVAASREARAIQDVEKAPDQENADEDLAQAEAEAAGEGGDNVLEAQVALTRARQLDAEGDMKGCQEALAEVERKLTSQGE